MQKVRLSVDELRVQSFTTADEPLKRRGTVHGHDIQTDEVECPTSWAATCANTCADTCQCEGNTGDCTVICYTDACSYDECTRGWWYATIC